MKFNRNAKGKINSPDAENYEGGLMFKTSAKAELIRSMGTAFLEDSFYESALDKMERIRKLVDEIALTDPEFVFKVAAFTRKEWWLRSAPVMLLGEMNRHNFGEYMRQYGKHVLTRADMPTELVAYIINEMGGKKYIRKQTRYAINDALNRFDRYQLAKYQSKRSNVKLRDVLRITHPVPIDKEHDQIFKAIVDENLKQHGTWEDMRSAGKSWDDVVQAMRMGYMATLRNLRNIAQSCNDDNIRAVANYIQDRDNVLRSRQLPFRFYSAYSELSQIVYEYPKVTIFVDAVRKAMTHALHNFPKLDGKTIIAVDLSGSMDTPVSGRTTISCADAAAIMGAAMKTINPSAKLYAFGDTIEELPLLHSDVFDYMNYIKNADVGHSTNGYKVIRDLIANNIFADRIIFFTDMQLYNYSRDLSMYLNSDESESIQSLMTQYRKVINPKAMVIVNDMRGYTNQLFHEHDPKAITVTGFNANIFKFINIMEQNSNALVKIVESYEFK